MPTFGPGLTYGVGNGPIGLVAEDFRGIGKTDLATSDVGPPTVSVLLGNGDGTFQPGASYANGSDTNTTIAAGVFTSNGLEDLAVPNYGNGQVTIFLNNGDGTFTQGNTYNAGAYPYGITAAALIPGGKVDLVAADVNSSSVGVLMGNGDGTFQPAVNVFANSNPNNVTVADFFGDGIPAIAVTNGNTNLVSVMRGNGDGTFQAPVAYGVGDAPGPLVSGDIELDGHPDIIVANSNDGNVEILHNQGNGTFVPDGTYPTSGGTSGIAIADINGDGFPDLVVSNRAGDVSILLNKGNGTFAPAMNFATGNGTVGVATGDFNGDGRPDVAAGNYNDNTVSVLLNDGVWPQYGMFKASGPSSTAAGATIHVTFTAYLDGVVDTGYTGTVQLSSSDPIAGLPSNYTFVPGDNGSHTFDVVLKTAGTQSVTATDTNETFTGTLSGITVKPGATSAFDVYGFPTSVTAGALELFTVQSADAYGNFAADYTGTVHFTSSDHQAELPGNYTFTTADNGNHIFAVGLLTAGTQSITATDVSHSSITGSQTGISVSPAQASSFTVTGFPSATVAGQTGTFTVSAFDAYGNLDTNYTGAVQFSSSDSQAVLPAEYGFSPSDQGKHLFAAVLKTGGSQSLTATDTSSASITGNQQGITVTAAALTSLKVAGLPSSVTAGQIEGFTVSGIDAFGNTVTSYRGTVHFTSSDKQAQLPANYTFTAADHGSHAFAAVLKTVGTQSITATDLHNATLTGTEAIIAVQPAKPAAFQITGLPATVHVGEAVGFALNILDAYGNLVTSFADPVQFSSSDSKATLPANYTYMPADGGSHNFGVIFATKGKKTLKVVDPLDSNLSIAVDVSVVA